MEGPIFFLVPWLQNNKQAAQRSPSGSQAASPPRIAGCTPRFSHMGVGGSGVTFETSYGLGNSGLMFGAATKLITCMTGCCHKRLQTEDLVLRFWRSESGPRQGLIQPMNAPCHVTSALATSFPPMPRHSVLLLCLTFEFHFHHCIKIS